VVSHPGPLRPSLPLPPAADELPPVKGTGQAELGLRVDVGGGGAIFAHNMLSHGDEMREFLEMIENHPDLETRIDRRSRAGISVSVKGR